MPKDRKIKVVDSLFLRSNCPPVFENANFFCSQIFLFGILQFQLFSLFVGRRKKIRELVLLGTPDTSLSGRRTRKARKAFTSKPSIFSVERMVLTTLEKGFKIE